MDLGEEKLAFARRFGTTIDQCERGRSGSSDSDLTNGRVDYAIDAIGLRRTKEQILRPTINGLFRSSVEEAPGITPPKSQAILKRASSSAAGILPARAAATGRIKKLQVLPRIG